MQKTYKNAIFCPFLKKDFMAQAHGAALAHYILWRRWILRQMVIISRGEGRFPERGSSFRTPPHEAALGLRPYLLFRTLLAIFLDLLRNGCVISFEKFVTDLNR